MPAKTIRMALRCLPLVLCSTAAFSQSAYRPPHTPDGHPDLQGMWNLSNLTPLERLREFTQLVISPTDAQAIEANIQGQRRNQPTGGEAETFHEERHVEPIRGRFHSSIIVDPSDGRIPGNALFKQKAAEFRASSVTAADGPEQRPAPERCLSSPAVAAPLVSGPSLNFHQIVQTPGAIAIHSEWNHEARIVRMSTRHAHSMVTSWLGDSIGRWEGDTLVVETRYFAPTSHTRSTAMILFFVSPQTVVTERITRTSHDELHYEFTVDDPTYYTQPWRGENRLVRSNDRIFEFACHEGNYALGFVLQGARSREVP
jgi:hypothetical protein